MNVRDSELATDYEYEAQALPCDQPLLEHVGRVMWNAIYLHGSIRDTINLIHEKPSDRPFELTLGTAVKKLNNLAPLVTSEVAELIETWCREHGGPAADARDGVAHAIVFGSPDGKAALRGSKKERPARYQREELVNIAGMLGSAARRLYSIQDAINQSRIDTAVQLESAA